MTKLQAKLAFKSVSDNSDISWKIKQLKISRVLRFTTNCKKFLGPQLQCAKFRVQSGLMLSMVQCIFYAHGLHFTCHCHLLLLLRLPAIVIYLYFYM